MPRTATPSRSIVGDPARMRVERFPVTILLGIQLLAMVVIPAALKGTEPFDLMTAICAVSAGVAFFFELMMQPLRLRHADPRPFPLRATFVVLGVGVAATIAATLGGRGSYAVQLGIAQESPIVSVASPFTLWLLFGAAMMLWQYMRGQVGRRTALCTLAAVAAVYLWEGLMRAILGQSAAQILTLLVLAVLAKLIRLRTIVAVIALIPLLWPPIYELRDALRRATSTGPGQVSANAPLERLQLDTQMALIAQFEPGDSGLQDLGLPMLLRIGLIPGFLDPDRPPLNTGSQMSVALGGSPTSSQSATMLGNVYIFEGWAGIVMFMIALTLIVGYLMRRSNAWALAGVGLAYSYGMSFNAAYPDVIPRALQAILSMAVAYVVVRVFSKPRRHPDDEESLFGAPVAELAAVHPGRASADDHE